MDKRLFITHSLKTYALNATGDTIDDFKVTASNRYGLQYSHQTPRLALPSGDSVNIEFAEIFDYTWAVIVYCSSRAKFRVFDDKDDGQFWSAFGTSFSIVGDWSPQSNSDFLFNSTTNANWYLKISNDEDQTIDVEILIIGKNVPA